MGQGSLREVGQALAPPGIVILAHLFPVVGREAPVLAIPIKVVRRRSCGVLHAEKVGMHPCVHTLLAHT